jgi:hypothetical protein
MDPRAQSTPPSARFGPPLREKRRAAGAALCAWVALLASSRALATDRTFTYTYESGITPAGHAELEPWVTYRVGRETYFHRYDLRVEFEGGLSPRLQSSLYLNFSSTAQDLNDELTGQRYRSQSLSFQGVSNEWKYQLSDPVADPIGTALYVEGTFAPQKVELEGKVIADKRLGSLVFAFNVVGEYEWEFASADTTYTYVLLEGDLGAAAFLTNQITLGAEISTPFRFYGTAPVGADDNGVLYAGPVLAARFEQWWMATTVLAQCFAIQNPTSGVLNLAEHERFQIRTVWGFHL